MTQISPKPFRTDVLTTAHERTYALGYLDGIIQRGGVITAERWNEALMAAMDFEQRRYAPSQATPSSV